MESQTCQSLQGTYVFAGVGADPYRDVDVWTARARRIDRTVAPLLHAAQSQSEIHCLKSILNGGIKDN